MSLRYVLADVFTDRPFGGNPLAVFPEADDVPEELMPLIAGELDLSETVFVLAPEAGGARRLRIFAPGVELPFAGHPTIGAACVLAEEGRIALAEGRGLLVLEEGVGPIEVAVEREGGRTRARLRSALLPERGPPAPPTDTVARLLSLAREDVLDGRFAPECFSCGVPFLIVPLRGLDALARARLDLALWERTLSRSWAPHVYALVPGASVRARMFAPAMGIAEDPATGAAAAALAGYLERRAGAEHDALRWVVEQGVEMGRPSRLVVSAARSAGALEAVFVGGESVRVGEGRLDGALRRALPRAPRRAAPEVAAPDG